MPRHLARKRENGTRTKSSRGRVTAGGLPPIYPPVYFLGALGLQIGLHYALPVRMIIDAPYKFAGIALILAPIVAMVWAVRAFAKVETTIRPFVESTMLVIRGLYRITRNPMYLSMVLILTGVAVLIGSATPFAVIPVFVVLIQIRFIRREEADLLARFGDEYEAYCSRVRRWI